MSDKLLIMGKGYIGGLLREYFKCDASDKKISSFKDAEAELARFNPGIVINAIGHVGRNVDECENDVDGSLFVNSFIPLILAEAAIRRGIRFVHISSGCIFHYDYSKNDPIDEEKAPDFFDLFYSRTKIYSELPLARLSSKYPVLVARLRVPLDNKPHPRNLLTKLTGFKKVIDAPNSITYMPDFAEALKHLIGIGARGTYNIVNKGALVYPDLLEIYKKHKKDFNYEIMDYRSLPTPRTNLVLSAEKLERAGFKMRPVKDILEECVREYVKY